MPKAWYNRLVDMLTSRFGALERNSNWNQHVRLLQSPRALPPDEPKIGTPALTNPRLQELIAGAIEEHLGVNHPTKSRRRSTRWLGRNETARLYHHRSRKVMPRLKNELRL